MSNFCFELKKNNEITLLGTDGKVNAGRQNFEQELREFIKKKIMEKRISKSRF